MPKRKDIKKILVIGAGPIIIGQACEFDYSGTQACKALKDEGYKVILINSNPATIMTDPGVADQTYIEPISINVLEEIIKKEKPNAILPTMGGQTALNIALKAEKAGLLKKYKIELIGANSKAISNAEDRKKFRKNMSEIGIDLPKSEVINNFKYASRCFKKIGLPAIIRPSFTLGGLGGGIARTKKDFFKIVKGGLDESPQNQVLVEECLDGWKEFEMEVVRDKNDNCIIICSIENVDPMGTHTGDSVTIAPALTLTDKEYQVMRNASIACLRKIGVETGGSNVQFAINPKNGRMVIIEMNPRVSRSSALASKATGFPIAKVAAKLAVGYTLDELQNEITKVTPASFEPTIDYVVTKIPRFTFEKFQDTKAILGTSMRSVGEAMAIGRNFKESFHKALVSLETGFAGLDNIFNYSKKEILKKLKINIPNKLLLVAEAFRKRIPLDKIFKYSKIDPWFLNQIKEIVEEEKRIIKKGIPKDFIEFNRIKSLGFSDRRLSILTNIKEEIVKKKRIALKVRPVFKKVDTCAAEFKSFTPYMYSTYQRSFSIKTTCESEPSNKKKIIILGGGPNRIGQGIEFDYCCCQASFSLKDAGFETIMINCNPETVSTDYDTSDRLYFEPLIEEYVENIILKEKSRGNLLGVITQFGGQTPIKLAKFLYKNNLPILGTQYSSIDLAEDRDRFRELLIKLNLKQAESGIASKYKKAINIAEKIGLPVIVRPSYVLGGRAMEIVHDKSQLKKFITEALKVSESNPILIDKFIDNAMEVDVDAICDGKDVYVAGIMQHIEEAGIHSGDSACCLPPVSIKDNILREIKIQTRKLALALRVKGFLNIQFAIKKDEIYVIEVNPRASRTVPFVSKANGIPLAKIASRVMTGEMLSKYKLKYKKNKRFAVKEAVFPFNKFPDSDLLLGPEMKSTGEVMGLDKDFGMAVAKSQIAASNSLPTSGMAFLSVKDSHKQEIIGIAQRLKKLGFTISATKGTAKVLKNSGIKCKTINKVSSGRPHIVDVLNSKKISLVINTGGGNSEHRINDAKALRRGTLANKIPYCTNMSTAYSFLEAIKSLKTKKLEVKSIQDN
ncbi:MAG: carbamoyl phosphate synthase large subunit [Candidatus Pelagibacter sp. TMED166]|mgnify:CR=1 FL=1|nr:MAG: carbamoyl phosphate synthase large subunit [Candidatus Pelagibacter sp. TMED166]|tara:strand:+ start:5384 stop:8608 length:3225 start_codon:yes stop_codon:yes gene_type:complete